MVLGQDGLDSRFRGNARLSKRDPIPLHTPARAVVGQFAVAALSERRNSLRIQDRRSETAATKIKLTRCRPRSLIVRLALIAIEWHLDIGPRRQEEKRLLSLNKFLQSSWRKILLSLTLLCGLALLVWPVRTLRSDNFVFYFPNSRRVIPLEVIENTKYLPLLQVLNLVGKLNGLQEKRNTLKVGFGNTHIELHADDPRIRVEKKTMILSAPIRVSNGKWMVPSDFLTAILPRLTGQGVEYQAGTNRVFFGDVKPGSFTLRMEPVSNGARLTFQFTDKVAVRTASVNGKWVMFLGDHPIEPLEQSFHFHNPYVTDVRFDDQDGLPKLLITPSAGGLNFYPSTRGRR